MTNTTINKDNFEREKNRILSISEDLPPTVSLKNFPTDGSIFSFNEHNVTGKEVNDLLVKPLQDILIPQNEAIIYLLKLPRIFYDALNTLDKEYISGIQGVAEGAKLASEQAKTASNQAKQASNDALYASREALDASKKAEVAQKDIQRTIEALQKTVDILKSFKADISIKLKSVTESKNALEKRIKRAYCIGGGAVVLSIIDIVLQLLGIL